MARFALLSLLALLPLGDASQAGELVNPIRRVVTMMQSMQKSIQAEGEKEAKLYEQFQCYCKSGSGDLSASIGDAETKIPQLQSDLEAAKAEKKQLQADIAEHTADRDAAKDSMKKATKNREQEASEFAKLDAESNANIDAMTKAIAAIEKGMAGGFLQTSAAAVLRQFVMNANIDSSDRDVLTSFLSQGQQYAPASGQIVGILKQMKDTWTGDLAEATKAEGKAKADYEGMMAAKTKLVNALQASIEEKTKRLGEVGVEIVNIAEDIDDTQKALGADQLFLKDLDKNCKKKAAEWQERQKTRADEMVALSDTIKLLNSDEALELFKKTLPTPSLVQVKVSTKEMMRRAGKILSSARKAGFVDRRLDFISLALHGKKVSFAKVIGMIDDMVTLLGREQSDDDAKKAYCEKEFDESEDEKKALERSLSLLDKAIEKNKADLETLTAEIAALVAGIKALDKSVAEATTQRREEHEAYKSDLAANTATEELLKLAKNRLNKFYNPKMYKAPAKRDLSEEERITVNMGGELAATSPPGGISGTGITASFVQVNMHSFGENTEAPAPPPETWDAYQKKGEESSGVISMIDLLQQDLAKEMQENEVDEKNAQEEYETFIADSATKRTDDSKFLSEKESVKADTGAELEKNKEDEKATLKEAMDNDKYISDLHMECDWLIANFQTRAAARAGEIESLKNAKAVLSGADYS